MRVLAPYAGHCGPKKVVKQVPGPTPYSLFKLGHDTHEIAKKLGIAEWKVHRSITLERSRERGLPIPYEGR